MVNMRLCNYIFLICGLRTSTVTVVLFRVKTFDFHQGSSSTENRSRVGLVGVVAKQSSVGIKTKECRFLSFSRITAFHMII